MKTRKSVLLPVLALTLTALFFLIPGTALAEEDYLTAEEYIEIARPYLHLSCEAAWYEAGEDQDAYIAIIDKVSAIGFLNHDLDVTKLGEMPKKDQEKVTVDFYTQIGERCRKNPNNLLAGVIEEALIHAFSIITPEGEMD